MAKRSYDQYCGLARALDLVGERWTLLIVRDLKMSPKRFGDLLAGLSGMGTSLLSERLRQLETEGVVRRAVADRGVVYELTDDGHALARAIAPLATWGAMRLPPRSDEGFRPEWLMFAVEAAFRPDEAKGVHDTYEFQIDGVTFWALVDDGTLTITQDEPPSKADFSAVLDVPTLAAIGAGVLDPVEAVARGVAKMRGDPDAALRARRVFGAV